MNKMPFYFYQALFFQYLGIRAFLKQLYLRYELVEIFFIVT